MSSINELEKLLNFVEGKQESDDTYPKKGMYSVFDNKDPSKYGDPDREETCCDVYSQLMDDYCLDERDFH